MVAKMFRGKGVDYIFDHHDICPELYEAKFGKAEGVFYKSQLWLEKQTYKHAKFAFVTNHSYEKIAIERGGMKPEDVFVLRSGPKLERLKIQPAKPEIKRGKKYMVGYLGVMGDKIIELLDNPEKRRKMGEYGRYRVINELSWEHTSKALLEGYDRYFKQRGL